jgi:AcrR family transcriptional regulator
VARPKSEDKRNVILEAATRLFAERGLAAAPTSKISNWAGVAEKTLFTYFRTKDDLINSLYREIKVLAQLAGIRGTHQRIQRRRQRAVRRIPNYDS